MIFYLVISIQVKLLLLLLIFMCTLQTGFTQTVQKQARQVITLQLMPVNVIELPAASELHKKNHSNNNAPVQHSRDKWFIQKQLPASTQKTQAAPALAVNRSNPSTSSSLNNAATNYPVVYTVTSL
jgi:hypothetical protein